jgi:hypothetical protein
MVSGGHWPAALIGRRRSGSSASFHHRLLATCHFTFLYSKEKKVADAQGMHAPNFSEGKKYFSSCGSLNEKLPLVLSLLIRRIGGLRCT